MNFPLDFQQIIHVPDPDNTPFKALKVCHNNKEILSVQYLTRLEKETLPQDKLAKKIVDRFRNYLVNPSSACFAALRTLPLCYVPLSPTRQKVSAAIQKIPYGKFCTYGRIATETSVANQYPGSVACKENPFAIVVPCFRVIYADGTLGGFKGNKLVPKYETSLKIKAWLLEHEKGVEVIRDSGKSADRWKVRCKSS